MPDGPYDFKVFETQPEHPLPPFNEQEQMAVMQQAATARGGHGEYVTAVPAGSSGPGYDWHKTGSASGATQNWDIYERSDPSRPTDGETAPGGNQLPAHQPGPGPTPGATPGAGPLQDVDQNFSPNSPPGATTTSCAEAFAEGAVEGAVVSFLMALLLAAIAPEALIAGAIVGAFMLGYAATELLLTWNDLPPQKRWKKLGELVGGLAGGYAAGKVLGPEFFEEGDLFERSEDAAPGEPAPKPADEAAPKPVEEQKPPTRPVEDEPPAPPKPDDKFAKLEKLKADREARLKQEALQKGVKEAEAKGKLDDLSPADRDWLNSDPRAKELAYDPARKSFKPNEARAILQAEKEGSVAPGVKRDIGVDGSETGADYVDGAGKQWDVKDSSGGIDTVVEAASPKGGQAGENVLVDLSGKDATERAAFKAGVRDKLPEGSGQVEFVPKD